MKELINQSDNEIKLTSWTPCSFPRSAAGTVCSQRRGEGLGVRLRAFGMFSNPMSSQ